MFLGGFSKYVFTASAHFVDVGWGLYRCSWNQSESSHGISYTNLNICSAVCWYQWWHSLQFAVKNLIYDWSVFFIFLTYWIWSPRYWLVHNHSKIKLFICKTRHFTIRLTLVVSFFLLIWPKNNKFLFLNWNVIRFLRNSSFFTLFFIIHLKNSVIPTVPRSYLVLKF